MSLTILGNGISRLKRKGQILRTLDEVWGCNRVFLEHRDIPRLTVVGTQHYEVAEEAVKYREDNDLDYTVLYSWRLRGPRVHETIRGAVSFNKARADINTGCMMVNEALNRGWRELTLLGFDLGGKHTHGHHERDGRHLRQWNQLCSEWAGVGLEAMRRAFCDDADDTGERDQPVEPQGADPQARG